MRTSKGLAISFSTVLLAFTCSHGALAQSKQEHVHGMAHSVMPFDISKTVHVFAMTDTGGIQRVVLKDSGQSNDVALIRRHLREEASRFQRGDYSDPVALHGSTMPGLKELHAGAKRIRIKYSDLPDGAQITFETHDRHLVTAIHRWFGAQLSEHGADAVAG